METTENQISVVNTYNEWDPLEEIIVGRAEYACVPEWHPTVKSTMPKNQWTFFQENGGDYFPEKTLELAAKELDILSDVLEGEGVVVRRPEPIDWKKPFSTPDFEQPAGLYGAMPRDYIIVFGDEIIESPMAWRSRYFEHLAYRPLIKEYFHQGARWTMAPKPQLSDELYNPNYDHSKGEWVVTEFEPVFDAAEFMRCGRDVFCQKSQVANQFGIDWLQRHLGDDYRIHVLDFDDPKAMHLDTTFVPLAPGRLMLNAERSVGLPAMFDSWEILNPPPPSIGDDHPLYFSSKWVTVNVLSIDEERVVVEEQETVLIQFLKDHGFKPVTVPFRNFMSLGGAFHCATCDIRRRGKLESYFD
ncbi:MAG: amidinotransferase [Chloroflexota bacterium]